MNRFLFIITAILISGSVCLIATLNIANAKENIEDPYYGFRPKSPEDLYQFIVEHKINNLNQLEHAYSCLFDLSYKTKNILPKYDQKDSAEAFKVIFSHRFILDELSKYETTEEKIQILVNYREIINRFLSMYMTKTKLSQYLNEYLRIGLLKIHSVLLIYELHDRYYKKNNISTDDIFENIDQLYIFKTNLHDEICSPYILWLDEDLDHQTREYATKILNEYITRSKAISFISEHDISYNKKACFGLMKERRNRFDRLKELNN